MSKKVRDRLFIIFIVLFIGLTVIFSLYASGYKFRLTWPLKFNKLLQKTGMLIVDSVPRGAAIYLDNEPLKDPSFKPWKKTYLKTAAKIRNLLPGEYLLRLERSGYWPFEKKIIINSGETTFVEDINLFLAAEPLLLTTAPAQEFSLSLSRRYLYLPATQEAWNLKSNSGKNLSGADQSQAWLNNEKLLSGGIIFTLEKNTAINYQKIIGAEASNWFYEETSGRLYYQNKNTLNRLEADGRTNTLILSGQNYLSYEPRGDHLYLVQETAGTINLQDYNLKTQKSEQDLGLPGIGHYQFIPDKRPTLVLYDDQNRTLYLLPPSNLDKGALILKNIISWQWLNDEQLLYNNPWEIYLFDLRTNRSTLITRVSEEISKILWHPGGNYLVFSTKQNLQAVDLKNGTITDLLRAEKIGFSILDDKNNLLYFWGKIKETEGIYKILLQ